MYALEAVGPALDPEERPGLSRLIAPLKEDAYLRQHLDRRPLLLTGRPGRFGALFDWPDLNELLAASRVDPARMHLTRALQGMSVTSCAEPLPQLSPGAGRCACGPTGCAKPSRRGRPLPSTVWRRSTTGCGAWLPRWSRA